MEEVCQILLKHTGRDICRDIIEQTGEEDICKAILIGGGATLALLSLALTPAILTALGFTAGGIVAGSIAAKLMSWFAILYGGSIPAGGLIALLQSIGAVGLSWITWILGGCTGITVGWLLSAICNQTKANEDLQQMEFTLN